MENKPKVMYNKSIPFSKRLLDVAIIILSLPITLPVFLLITGYIKLRSPGPIFFKQKRIGLGGVSFNIIKFRTMKVGADVSVHKNHFVNLVKSDKKMKKMDDVDPRIIPGGKLIRASGLDELPQLINVLMGEMSLVGPRPCTIQEEEMFHDRTRFNTLPGLTGLWQVRGKNETTFEEMVKLDSIYVNKRSLWVDINIIIETPWVLVNQIVKSIDTSTSPVKQFDTEFINR